MIFLGQASNYKFGRVLRHLFARGKAQDSLRLRSHLAKVYQVEQHDLDEPGDRVLLYHTGRSALAAAILAVAPKGSRVIIPGLTCIAVVRAVRAAGCEPVFVDIDPETLQYDWQKLEQTLEALRNNSKNAPSSSIDKNQKVCYNVSTIVAQNTLGLPLDMQKLEKLAQKYHLEIVEDLAHSAGRFYADGRKIGSVGAATALSFGKGKAIDTISGGALVLRSAKFTMPSPPRFAARRSARWRERWYPALGAIIRAGYHVKLGKVFTAIFLKLGWIERSADAELNLDARLGHWQAKLAWRQLEQFPVNAKQQAKVFCAVSTSDQDQTSRITDKPKMQFPLREHYFVRQRNKLLAELEQKGYYLNEIWYDTPVSPSRYLKEADFPNQICPQTVAIAKTIINLPTWYPEEKLAPVRQLIQPYILDASEIDELSHPHGGQS